MSIDKYILDKNNNPILESDLLEWAKWMEKANRIVLRQTLRQSSGKSIISTVFLGLDHSFGGKGKPILWETMVFGGKLDQEQIRCGGSIANAKAMHRKMVEKVRESEK